MVKYYRVKKTNFMWEEGAILKSTGDGYRPISDIWNHVELRSEYISDHIIENKENVDWFERVYEVNMISKVVYEVKEKAKELIAKGFKSDSTEE